MGLGALAVLLLTAGCSSTSPKSGIDTFSGSWTFDSGTLSGTGICPGLPLDLADQTFMMVKGTTSDLLFTLGTCDITVSTSGTSAMAAPAPQMCMFTIAGMAVAVTISSWTMQSTNGQSLTTTAMGTALGGACMFTLTGAATKDPTPDGSAG